MCFLENRKQLDHLCIAFKTGHYSGHVCEESHESSRLIGLEGLYLTRGPVAMAPLADIIVDIIKV